MACQTIPPGPQLRPAELQVIPGVDFCTLTYAYCRWKAEGTFEQIFYASPDMNLHDFLEWIYSPTVEALGCYMDGHLVGIGWICQARKVGDEIMSEVGGAFFQGVSRALWRQCLERCLQYGLDERKFAAVFGLVPKSNRDGRAMALVCGMREVESLPWDEAVSPEVAIYRLDRARS